MRRAWTAVDAILALVSMLVLIWLGSDH
jgi:hypothetical protein